MRSTKGWNVTEDYYNMNNNNNHHHNDGSDIGDNQQHHDDDEEFEIMEMSDGDHNMNKNNTATLPSSSGNIRNTEHGWGSESNNSGVSKRAVKQNNLFDLTSTKDHNSKQQPQQKSPNYNNNNNDFDMDR